MANIKALVDNEWAGRGATCSIMGGNRNPKLKEDIDTGEYHQGKIHGSHHEMILETVVFCKECGYHASKKTQKLTEECPLMPVHNDAKCKLNRIMKGKHPDRNVLKLPDGQSTQDRILPINLGGS